MPSGSARRRRRTGARWTRPWRPAGPSSARSRSTWTSPAPRRSSRRSAPPASPSQSGLVLRSAPVFRELRDLVQGGTLGAPMAAVFRDDQYFPIQGTYASQWRADVAQAGGGCLIEHSIHDLDILRFCFGDVDSVVGPDGQPCRPPRHRGPGRRHALLRLGVRGPAHQRLARHLEPGLDAPAGGLLPRGHGVAGRRVPRPAPRPDQRRHRGAGRARRRRGWTRSRWRTTRSAWPCAPTSRRTGAFIDAVTAGRPPEPGPRRRPGGPPPGRRRLPFGRRRRSADERVLDSRMISAAVASSASRSLSAHFGM